MQCIRRETRAIEYQETVEDTAIAMINLLIMICTYYTGNECACIYSRWSDLICSTFNYIHTITNEKQSSENKKLDLNDNEELTVAETAWFFYTYTTFAPLKEQLKNTSADQTSENRELITQRIHEMPEIDRWILLALTHKTYQKEITALLNKPVVKPRPGIETQMLTKDKGGSQFVINMLQQQSQAPRPRHRRDTSAIEKRIQNYVNNSAFTVIRMNMAQNKACETAQRQDELRSTQTKKQANEDRTEALSVDLKDLRLM